jgi:DNA-binding LacI/PurR family transcriptional regulator
VVNDNTAMGVITCCRENGYGIPEDIAILGFSDIDMAGMIDISLSTIKIPAKIMGEKAASLLLEYIEDPRKYDNPERIVLPVSLVRRDSTRI